MCYENQERESGGDYGGTELADQELVPCDNVDDHRHATGDQYIKKKSVSSAQHGHDTSTVSKNETAGSTLIRESIQNTEVPSGTRDILMASWRNSTRERYKTPLNKWALFCNKRNSDPFRTTVEDILTFLTEIFETGVGLGTLQITRSALNTIIELPGYPDISQHPLIQRFFKGAFNIRPPPTPQQHTWDVNTLLTHIQRMPSNEELNLKDLTLKLVALLMLLASSRVHYIHSFSIRAMAMDKDTCTFYPTIHLKHSRPSFPGDPITYTRFPDDNNLCVINCLTEYINRRHSLVDDKVSQLLITHRKPYHAAHKDTVARWLKEMLREAGIDTTRYTAHSYRAASTSMLKDKSIAIDEILKRGQWSNTHTFTRYYQKQIEYDIHMTNRVIV